MSLNGASLISPLFIEGTWGKNREHVFYFAALVLVISAIKMVFHVHFSLKKE